MIVDDSNIIRNKIERHISQNPIFELVATATNGVEALQKFRQFRPTVVTMDITMPQMDGLECIKEMMEIDPQTNILVVSAVSDEYSGLLALKLGARGFLYKPFTEEELGEALSEILENL